MTVPSTSIPEHELVAFYEELAREHLCAIAGIDELPSELSQQLPEAIQRSLPHGYERLRLIDDVLDERRRQEEIFRRVQRIQIAASHVVNDVLAGEYVSVFKGRGMEFEEVREYQPGDEVRTIDWNVTARMGHPFVKRFVEERELTVMLLVDTSASGEFGTVGKLKNDAAAEVCAILAFSAIRNNDKVGLILFSDRVEKFVPPKKGKSHVLRVIRELLVLGARRPMSAVRQRQLLRIVRAVRMWPQDGFPTRRHVRRALKRWRASRPARPDTDIAGALDFLGKITKRRSVVFLVSDFIATDYEHALHIANRRHDVIVIRVVDPRETTLPPVGLIELQDAESGEVLCVDANDANVRRGLEALVRREDEERSRRFRSMDVDEIVLRTDESPAQPLVRFFRQRERKR